MTRVSDPDTPAAPSADHRAEATRGVELVIVTGMSGAGRSTVGNLLEDLGWYVVDNLPPSCVTSAVISRGTAAIGSTRP